MQKFNLKVSELRAALEGVADDVDVVVELPPADAKSCNFDGSPGYHAHVTEAKFYPASSISNDELVIKAGDTFSY